MKKLHLLSLIAILFIIILNINHTVSAATPPDIIHLMEVTITPQTDGSLNIHYLLDYEATTDFPSDIQYLEIGVPNSDFTLKDFSPSSLIKSGKANTGQYSQVHLDFIKLPQKDDRFQLEFTINQRSMLYNTDAGLCFQFRPGWFDFAVINEMRVVLDTSSLNGLSVYPSGEQTDSTHISWVTKNMTVNQQTDLYTVTCNASSFPELNTSNVGDKANNNNNYYYSSTGNDTGESDAGVGIMVFFFVVVVIIIIAKAIYRSNHGYVTGRYGGGYKGGNLTNTHPFFGGGLGGGGFHGGGCACACACACAGGGRVGCSERGYQVLYWLIKKKSC